MFEARGSRAPRIAVTVLAAAAVLAQLYGLYRPAPPPTEPWFPNQDKLEHALGFAIPVFLVLLAVGRLTLVVPLVFAVHAVVSELIQWAWYTQRTGDVRDVLADLVGVGIGVGGFVLVDRHRRARVEAAA